MKILKIIMWILVIGYPYAMLKNPDFALQHWMAITIFEGLLVWILYKCYTDWI